MLRIVTGETADVFVPEEEIPEVLLLGMYRQCPGQAHQHRDQHGHAAVGQQFAQALLPGHVGQGDQHRQQPGEETLGHETHAAGQSSQRPVAQAGTWRLAVKGQPQPHQAQVDPEGELRIEVGIAALADHHAETHVEQGAGQALARVVPQAPGNQVGQHDAQAGAQGRGHAHTKQVVAK
ncbi:hypothetical protein D3C81_1772990 [compost metagenome]